MLIRESTAQDHNALAELVAAFRAELAALRGRDTQPDLIAAAREIHLHGQQQGRFHVAEEAGRLVGYLLCRVDGATVWAEHLYVLPAWRRHGIAGALYEQAEALAETLGSTTVYNWIHPNNRAMVAFLRNRGYDVLNLVEVRRPAPGEQIEGTMQVGSFEFRY